jgi:hypothetical protein
MVILEINFTGEVEAHQINIHQKIFKHLPGILILLIYYLYDFAWAEYHAGHYPIAMVKEFTLLSSLDRHSNFVATIGTFYFLYSGLFLVLNKFWLNKGL